MLNFATMHPVASFENTISFRMTGYFTNRTEETSFLTFNISFNSLTDELIRDIVNFREDVRHVLRQLDAEYVPRHGYVVGATTNVRQSDLINEAQRIQDVADQSVFEANATSEILLRHIFN